MSKVQNLRTNMMRVKSLKSKKKKKKLSSLKKKKKLSSLKMGMKLCKSRILMIKTKEIREIRRKRLQPGTRHFMQCYTISKI